MSSKPVMGIYRLLLFQIICCQSLTLQSFSAFSKKSCNRRSVTISQKVRILDSMSILSKKIQKIHQISQVTTKIPCNKHDLCIKSINFSNPDSFQTIYSPMCLVSKSEHEHHYYFVLPTKKGNISFFKIDKR
jgi:hypothetical protein